MTIHSLQHTNYSTAYLGIYNHWQLLCDEDKKIVLFTHRQIPNQEEKKTKQTKNQQLYSQK